MRRSKAALPHPKFLNPLELAKRWRGHVSKKTLQNWRNLGKGPPFQKLPGGRVRYALADVVAFEDANTMRRSPSKPAAEETSADEPIT